MISIPTVIFSFNLESQDMQAVRKGRQGSKTGHDTTGSASCITTKWIKNLR
jgi:hypothetical protein